MPVALRPCKRSCLVPGTRMAMALLFSVVCLQPTPALPQAGASLATGMIEVAGAPEALRPLLVATAALLENAYPLTLVVTDAGPRPFTDLQQLPPRIELLTPTRYILERIERYDDPEVSRVILARLLFPGDQAGGPKDPDDSPTLRALSHGTAGQALIEPETLLLTTARLHVDNHATAYRQLLAALNTALLQENAARRKAAGELLLRVQRGELDTAQTFFYSLSLDWSLITSLQLRLALSRHVYPESAALRHDILTWIAPESLAEVAPASVDRIFLSTRDRRP